MEAGKETCIGFDVGKAAHRACAVSCKTGEILFNGAIENREGPIDEVLGLAGRGALVVVCLLYTSSKATTYPKTSSSCTWLSRRSATSFASR